MPVFKTSTPKGLSNSVSMPGSGGPDTRVTAGQVSDSKDIALKWYYDATDNEHTLYCIASGNASMITAVETTATSNDARTSPLVTGNACHLYALWLSFASEADVQAYKITMTIFEEITDTYLWIDAAEEDQSDVWIDLNNNGIKDKGEEVTVWRLCKIYHRFPNRHALCTTTQEKTSAAVPPSAFITSTFATFALFSFFTTFPFADI